MSKPGKILILKLLAAMLALLLVQTVAEWAVMRQKIQQFVELTEGRYVTDPYVPGKPIHREGEDWLGSPGDIPLTFEAVNLPVMFLVGGHSGVVVDEETVVESSGLEAWEKNITKLWGNRWKTRYDEVLLLRVKGASPEDYTEALQEAKTLLGRRYDYLFSPTDRWIYCSEVPWRAWRSRGFQLNYDSLWVTPNDLLISPQTYIVYYQYRDPEGILHTYSLEDQRYRSETGKETIHP